ncbi:hypothetical protein SAMN05216304_111117 [Bosea sp. OK403]|nr:hypothetical protein SAMN05216304_111117 [Bosea sp. OK403]
MAQRSKSDDRKARNAAEVQLFVQRAGRKTRAGGLDPNDRNVDHRVAEAVRRMKPDQLDALLRDGEDE